MSFDGRKKQVESVLPVVVKLSEAAAKSGMN
jgi:hypothetical protein